MNLLDKKLGLLMIVALLFFSCEEEIGELSIAPENNLGIFFAEVSLKDRISQVWAGSSPSSFNGVALAGAYRDSIAGEVTSTAYFDYTIASLPFDSTFETASLESLVLNLRVTNAYGPFDKTDIQIFDLYEIENFDSDLTFNSSLELDLGEKVGESQFMLYPDSINLPFTAGLDSSKIDTDGIYRYNIPFTFTRDFESNLFNLFKSEVLRGMPSGVDDIDSTIFYLDKAFKGFALVPRNENTAIIGHNSAGIVNFDFLVNYSVTNTNGNIKKSQARIVPKSVFNKITPNENQPWVGGKFNELATTDEILDLKNDFVYFQSGTNMFITVDASNLISSDIMNSKSIIQKATLKLSNIQTYSPIKKSDIVFSAIISSKDLVSDEIYSNLIPNGILSDLPRDVTLNADSTSLTLDVPLYLQGLVEDKIIFDKIIFGVNPSISDSNLNGFYIRKEDITLSYYYTLTD